MTKSQRELIVLKAERLIAIPMGLEAVIEDTLTLIRRELWLQDEIFARSIVELCLTGK
jgi:hypothetical protein